MKQALAGSQTEGFYVIGGTLRRDAPSYIARDADEQLYRVLKKGEVCFVLTARQMGKSSLMVQTAARLREEGAAVAVLDLTALGQNLNEEEWYSGLLEIIGEQLNLEHELQEFWSQNQMLGCLQRWMLALREVVLPNASDRVVIFIDEIDAVRSLRFSTDEFFAGIRQLYNHRTQDLALTRLTFCLLGVASPSDLIRDTRTTPFNIGRRIELSDFVEDEAAPLARGLGQKEGLGVRLLRRVLYWTGGHPYLTQRLCQAVADASPVSSTGDVDRICAELFLSQRARERDDNLLFVRERLLRSEVDTPSLLTLYEKVRSGKKVIDDQTNPLVPVLRLSGITRADNGCLRVRNRVYERVFDREWIKSNMPGAEVRRQRAAYVRGIKVISVPALLVLAVGSYIPISIYRRSVAAPQASKTPVPPPFWASFSASSAATSSLGALVINAGQAGVAVSINKREYGLTNAKGELTVPLLEVGNYLLEVQKPGFQALTQQVKIESQKQTQLTVQLVRPVIAGSSATIEGAPPGAEVRLDGKLLGITAADGTFLLTPIPGAHTLQVAKGGFFPQETKEMFAPGKSFVRRAALQPDVEFQRWQALSNPPSAILGEQTNQPGPVSGFMPREHNPSLAEINRFIHDFPNSRFTAQARVLQEQAQWNSLKGGKDLEALTAFVNKSPQGPYAADARILMDDLQREQELWVSARASKDITQLQAYLTKYPEGQYAGAARDEIAKLSDIRPVAPPRDAADKTAVLEVIKQYQQAYDERNVEELRKIWPSMDKSRISSLRDFFRTASTVKSSVHIDQEPLINGDEATVKFTQLITYVMKGRESKPFALTSTAKLKRAASTTQGAPGGWKIDSLSAN